MFTDAFLSIYLCVWVDRLLTKLPSSSRQLYCANNNNPLSHICNVKKTLPILEEKYMKFLLTTNVIRGQWTNKDMCLWAFLYKFLTEIDIFRKFLTG